MLADGGVSAVKVLVVAPHMDDEVLGCGASIARHVEAGDEVHVCFIAHRVYDHRYDEARNEVEKGHANAARKVLGYGEAVFFGLDDERLDLCVQDILIPLEEYIYKFRPHTVYCPFRGDNNQDHRAVFDAARVALRPSAAHFVDRLLMYETPSSTEQSPPLPENVFYPNLYVDVKAQLGSKIEALACYETEKRAFPHPRSAEAVEVLARKRGVEAGFEYAEAFMVLREMWRSL
ncbi:MAG TPA: PIG-L family deacetylase [Deltaproteobacteria bacterium]|nr:PIG-L family deacetylase [Deltaproteobacteria bacterium]